MMNTSSVNPPTIKKILFRFVEAMVLLGVSVGTAMAENRTSTMQQSTESSVIESSTTFTPRKTSNPQSANAKKNIISSGGVFAPPDGLIDDGGSASSITWLNVTASGVLSAGNVALSATSNRPIPSNASIVIKCDITTQYFTTVGGSQPNDDHIVTTNPLFVISNKTVSFVCPYKSSAHALNSAKDVSGFLDLSILYTAGGTTYKSSDTFSQSCTRTTKLGVFVCQ